MDNLEPQTGQEALHFLFSPKAPGGSRGGAGSSLGAGRPGGEAWVGRIIRPAPLACSSAQGEAFNASLISTRRYRTLLSICARAVKDIRIVYDRHTGQPRGLAFVHFYSVADATAALEALQGAAVEGQAAALQLSYARDRLGPAGDAAGLAAAGAGAGGEGALEPAVAAAYAGWEPKSLEEAEAEAEGAAGACSGNAREAAEAAAGDGGGQDAAAAGQAGAAAEALPPPPPANHPPGFSFSYDPGSG